MWGDEFGRCVDKFGIRGWSISARSRPDRLGLRRVTTDTELERRRHDVGAADSGAEGVTEGELTDGAGDAGRDVDVEPEGRGVSFGCDVVGEGVSVTVGAVVVGAVVVGTVVVGTVVVGVREVRGGGADVVGCEGTTAPAPGDAAPSTGSGRTTRYSARTAKNATASARVEVRTRPWNSLAGTRLAISSPPRPCWVPSRRTR